MIANLKLLLLLLLTYAALDGNAKSSPNKYQKIAKEYNITPYGLEYGYPLWYKLKEQTNSDVIFLSNEVEELRVIESYIYITKPTKKKGIEIVQLSKLKAFDNKYYLVLDQSITMKQLNVFLEGLGENNPWIDICLVGKNGNYIPITYRNESYFTDNANSTDCKSLPQTKIVLQGLHAIFFYGESLNNEQLAKRLEKYLGHNMKDDECFVCPIRLEVDANKCLQDISFLENEFERSEKNPWVAQEIVRLKRKLELIVNNSPFVEMSKSFEIFFEVNENVSLEDYFKTLASIQFGTFKARNNLAKDKWGLTYFECMISNRNDELTIIDLAIPDKITVNYNRYEEITSVPVPPYYFE